MANEIVRPPMSLPSAAPLLQTLRPDGVAELDWRAYWLAVRRHRWLVVGVTLGGTILGFAGTRLIPPTYQAQATVWVQAAQRGERDPGPIYSGQLLGNSGWDELLRSDVVLEAAAHSQQLYVKPKAPSTWPLFASLTPAPAMAPGRYRLTADAATRTARLEQRTSRQVQVAAFGDTLGRDFGFSWVPPESALVAAHRIEFTLDPEYEAALQLGHDLHIRSGREGSFLALALRGPDAKRAAATLNAVTTRFVTVAADLKKQKLTELVRILGDQLAQAQGNLRRSEDALKAFRARTAGLIPVGGTTGDPLFANLLEARISRDQVHGDRVAIERVLAQIPDSGLASASLEMLGSVQRASELSRALQDLTTKKAELRSLRLRYTDTHIPVQRLIQEVNDIEQHTIPALAQGLAAELGVREAALTEHIASTAGGLEQVSPLAVEEAGLARDVAISDQLFSGLRQRYEEARLAEVSAIPDVRVLTPALVPQRPVNNLTPLVVLLALLGSFSVAVGGAVVYDRVDPKLRRPEQVQRQMGLTVLGVLPHVTAGDAEAEGQLIEGLRVVRLNLVHSYGTAGPVIFTVTSPGTRDGKSFIASNLALGFAEAGQRTVLVDGDIRRGSLHRLLGADRKPGLIDYLQEQVTREAALQATRYANLQFMACGTRAHEGPELLTSPRMVQLLAALRAAHDVVIVDSAPMAAGADPYMFGTLTGNVLLVLRTGVTDRLLAEAKVATFSGLPVRLLGAVLNDVKAQEESFRYYSYYLSGYEVVEEPAPRPLRPPLMSGR